MKLKKKVKIKQEDIEALEKIDRLGVKPSKLNEFDFKNVAVVKPWGYEYLAFETDDKKICAWVLHMKSIGEQGTSIHCHRNKQTLISVIKGRLWVRTLTDYFELAEGENMYIDKSTFHAMGAMTDETILTEIESPSFKPDAIRYIDNWGREREEYESHCQLKSINSISCPYLDAPDLNDKIKNLVYYAKKIFKQ